MASLWKRERSPYYYACYYSADGRRVKKCTKLTDKKKAMDVALTWERAEAEGRRGTLTENQARKVLSEILERTTGHGLVTYTADSWLRDWLKSKAAARSGSTHQKYGRTVESFLAHLGSRARLNVNQITPRDVLGYRDAEIAAGKHPNTCNFAVKHLRTAFNAARRQGLITHNPAEAVEAVALPDAGEHGEQGREGFTAEQIEALLSAASPDWHTVILVAFYVGARLQDAANMQWKSVNLPEKTIRYRARKTGQILVVPLHPRLEAHLVSLPSSDQASGFLAPSLAGKSTAGKSGLSMAFRRIMDQAKVAGTIRRAAKGKGRTVNSLTFHSLRHSFNSAMANAGVAQEMRQKLTGHASPEMNKIYTHYDLDRLRLAVGVLPTLKEATRQ